MLDDAIAHSSETTTFPTLRGRVADVQARVREHTTQPATPEALAQALRGHGLEAGVDTSAPGGRPLVRVDDDDIALLFAPHDGALVIVDVRRGRVL